MPSGWAVLGDHQFFRGYCLLLPDPVVPDLNHLADEARGRFLLDMTRIGDALLAETASHRINYEILGNTDEALHAHVFPRYRSEPDRYRRVPVWRYPAEQRRSVEFDPAEHGSLRRALEDRLRGERKA
jgi:diadenosine tetraphosphate (Ap4A) HIT family hydrolase